MRKSLYNRPQIRVGKLNSSLHVVGHPAARPPDRWGDTAGDYIGTVGGAPRPSQSRLRVAKTKTQRMPRNLPHDFSMARRTHPGNLA